MAIFCLFLVVVTISCFVPPLQSADEEAHLARAYLLGRGHVLLGSQDGKTGGYVDNGLLAYINVFEPLWFNYDKKITTADLHSARSLRWTAKKEFTALPNTAYYFPLPYLPEAVALALGEHMGLRVETTYYLTRLSSLIATLGVLWAAAILYPMPPVAIALLLTPMALFQLGSATLDPITFAAATLTASLFKRGSDPSVNFGHRMHIALILCVLSLSMSRIALIPLTLLPAALYKTRHARRYVLSSSVCLLLSLVWIAYGFLSVKGMLTRDVTTLDMAAYYVTHPVRILTILWHTVQDRDILTWYWTSFIGMLGYVDTPLDAWVYSVFALIFVLLSAISLSRHAVGGPAPRGGILVLVTVLSLLLILLIELLAWDSRFAPVIEGVQGRYFIPIATLFAYDSLSRPFSRFELKLSVIVLIATVTVSVTNTATKVLYRYWVS